MNIPALTSGWEKKSSSSLMKSEVPSTSGRDHHHSWSCWCQGINTCPQWTQSAFTGLTQHSAKRWSLSSARQSISRAQSPVMITIVLMFPRIMARKWRVVSPRALCLLLEYNFLFRGLNLSCQWPGRGALADCESVARSIVSESGVRLYYFRLLRIVAVKWHSLSPALKTIIILNYKKNKANLGLIIIHCNKAPTMFYELIIPTCKNCFQFEALLMLPFFPRIKYEKKSHHLNGTPKSSSYFQVNIKGYGWGQQQNKHLT